MKKKCKECGSEDMEWAFFKHNSGGAVNGRLVMHDIQGMFALGCNECSATNGIVSAEYVAKKMPTFIEGNA